MSERKISEIIEENKFEKSKAVLIRAKPKTSEYLPLILSIVFSVFMVSLIIVIVNL